MKITIDTDVLQKEHLTLQQFLVLLIAYRNIDYKKVLDELIEHGLAMKNVYDPCQIILSNNSRDDIARILVDCNKNVSSSDIDFETIAVKLREMYPNGYKPGTTYLWKDSVATIANKLKILVGNYNFRFTEQEAVSATQEYLDSYKTDKSRMKLLKYFILRIDSDELGNKEINSEFMSIIENNREHKDNHETDDR